MPITLKNVNYTYNSNTPLAHIALTDVNLTIKDNKVTALIGHTGSGKSTLLQLFDGLLKPTTGEVRVNNYVLTSQTKNKGLKSLRKEVGIVFQSPENQLFAETVLKDVMFGPQNFGYSDEEAESAAKKWLKKVGISEELFNRSPFDLSGGQMRRVAIAGVLAYEPKILCLDEPAAGLDPSGKEEILSIFRDYQQQGHGVILVSHDMNDVANFADEVVVMDKGKVAKQDNIHNIFSDPSWLQKHHLNEPESISFSLKLRQRGLNISPAINVKNLADEIIKNRGAINE
ncbi:energy-coupling factor transporter ATPase [Lactobacillus rodentium]|uniref:Energy-coupling factor transporter ATP-binding protein EcfA2 n=1 Tax=Lactobacillus rodentium TaxID=947835 RepID=A0A2Z6T6X4_9LACO|nr:energy-coupling factor transporter ATPase [Lactobacillus rodentium]MCR1893903.1 energy-coupling factor transporter ATPase [Lactobacillus rodentium]GBG04231.1 energy-coupling factor transporter ATP-binding protein [Lactobacillus rodentium]